MGKKLTQEEKDARKAKRQATLDEKKLKQEKERQVTYRKMEIERAKSELMNRTPPPSRKFKVGQEAVAGFRMVVRIKEVLKDGLVYIVTTNDGEKNEQVYPWHKLSPKTQKETVFSQKDELRLDFMRSHLSDVVSSNYYSAQLDMCPDYQRDLVWSDSDKEALIDSIFANRDIGKFVFIDLGDYSQKTILEILDGKQRLAAIVEFLEDGYVYRGHLFSELSFNDRHHFNNTTVTYAISRKKLTTEEKLRYFLNLNTRGVDQTKDHLDVVRIMLDEGITREEAKIKLAASKLWEPCGKPYGHGKECPINSLDECHGLGICSKSEQS